MCVCVCVLEQEGVLKICTLCPTIQFVLRSFCILELATDTKRYEVNVDHAM